MQDNEVIRLQIPGLPEFIGIARHAVDAVSEQMRLPRDSRMAVKLAVGEACNNAVLHANDGQRRVVVVACRAFPGALEIEVTNQGNGFHPGAGTPMPRAEDLSEHGRGMPLMELMMDSVEYLSVDGNTTVRMRKNFVVPA